MTSATRSDGRRATKTTRREDVVADMQELIDTLPADCAPIAVYSYLTRHMRSAGHSGDGLNSGGEGPARGARLLVNLADFVEGVAEGIGGAADVAARHAAAGGRFQDEWADVAERTAGSYDALVGAASVLRGTEDLAPGPVTA
ncbi:hypothetical protein [Actinomadura sp. 3N407]|uniref:hypothetical protein n=1 Tax=Actinomadura sp. 3N407 TaxID=3457423 RepID=UPI003FCDF0F5